MTYTWSPHRTLPTTNPARGRSRKWPAFRPRCETLEDRCLLSVDVILEWNAVMLQANAVDHGQSPPAQPGPNLTARAFAVASLAMYDAYNSVHRIGEPYLILVPFAEHVSSEAAVAQAAHTTLSVLYPSQQDAFDAALTRTLARVPDGEFEDMGRLVGLIVAGRILFERADDNADTVQDPPYVPSGLLGFHNVDPTNPGQGFYAPDYEDVTPFALFSADQFEPLPLDDATPAGRAAFLRTARYTNAYREVWAAGAHDAETRDRNGDGRPDRTREQTEIGLYWAYDGRPGLGTPPRLYNQIARQIASQEHNTEAENARLFALLNLAQHDAGLNCWNRKWDDDFWRPILGVRNGGGDGNPATPGEPAWRPLGAPTSNPRPGETINFTPPFPAYTSGHATFGAAAFKTLERFYGRDNITFTFVSDELNGVTRDVSGAVRPLRPRTFHSLSQASEENGQSRIYLGIHWAFDKTQGILNGNRVANFVFNNFLRPGDGHLAGVSVEGGDEGAGVAGVAAPGDSEESSLAQALLDPANARSLTDPPGVVLVPPRSSLGDGAAAAEDQAAPSATPVTAEDGWADSAVSTVGEASSSTDLFDRFDAAMVSDAVE